LTGAFAGFWYHMKIIPFAGLACLMASCSSLPIPQRTAANDGKPIDPAAAVAVLKRSAAAHGDPWQKCQQVRVCYDGTWTQIATKLQPVITDPQFRKSSEEIYQPKLGKIRQTHCGPAGIKTVLRQRRQTTVTFNGTRSADPEVRDAAALVADAYQVFTFGSSWLSANARDLALLSESRLSGVTCQRVSGRLSPGLGNSKADDFIAWIEKDTGLLRRFQFSLNGLESTRGADVDVVFSEFLKAANGTIWARHYLETIQRPLKVKAHEWRLTALRLGEHSEKISP
jgi:hypothetical protein